MTFATTFLPLRVSHRAFGAGAPLGAKTWAKKAASVR